MDESEIERRQRYWFEHWQQFTCEVVVNEPQVANAHVGAVLPGALPLFGSLPVPMHTTVVDRGTFSIHDDCVWVTGRYTTYCWPIRQTSCLWFPDGSGAEMRPAGQPVVTLRGPVAAPLAGAYYAYGLTNQN